MVNTVAQAFAASAAQSGRSPFLIVPARADRDWQPAGGGGSPAGAAREIDRLRALYAAAGYGLGHGVALLLENRPEFFLHYPALNGLGTGVGPGHPDDRHHAGGG